MESVHLINRKTHCFLATISVVFCVFIGSFIFAPYYFGGDQQHYIKIFDEVKNLSLPEAYELYKSRLVTFELGHFIVIWVTGILGIEKNLVMALANSTLAYFIMKFCNKWGVSLLVSSSICITNFYLLVLYFSAERLKFGFLFFFISIYYLNNFKKSVVFSCLSVVSHLQFFILYLSLVFPKFFSEYLVRLKRILKTLKVRVKSELFIMVILLTMGIFIWLFMGDHLSNKLIYHSNFVKSENAILNITRVFIFFCMTILYAKKKYKVIILNYLPLVIAIYFVGGSRLNIFAYLLFMSYALQYKRGLNFGVLITSIYYFFKSIGFVKSVVYSGYAY